MDFLDKLYEFSSILIVSRVLFIIVPIYIFLNVHFVSKSCITPMRFTGSGWRLLQPHWNSLVRLLIVLYIIVIAYI